MNTTNRNESSLEQTGLSSWFAELGYEVAHGQDIAPGEPAAERDSYDQVILAGRLEDAVERLNPTIPVAAREEAVRKVLYPESPALIVNNRRFHAMLRDGVEVEYRRADGSIAGDRVRLIDYDDPENDDWLGKRGHPALHSRKQGNPSCVGINACPQILWSENLPPGDPRLVA